MLLVCCASACSKKRDDGIAELTKATGPVERQAGGSAWSAAAIGARFYLGDAARTGDGTADLLLVHTQALAMSPHTVVRFSGDQQRAANVQVDIGQVEVVNTAQVGIDIGNVQIQPGAKVRFTPGQVELLIGKAELLGSDLAPNAPVSIEIGKVVVVDAGVPHVDAAPALPPDAAVPAAADVTYSITGKGAEVQQPGETTWKTLTGTGTLPLGAKLRMRKPGARATLTSGTTTLELAGAARLTVRANLLMGMELGAGVATVPAAGSGAIGVPGGEVDISAPAGQAAEAKLDVDARGEAKIAMAHGTAKLVGAGEATLELAGGESATLLKAGQINPGVVIPRYFDFRVDLDSAPRSFWIHDPEGATAVAFAFGGKCPTGGTLELDRDARFRTPRVSEGKESANMLVPAGTWSYRVKCANGAIGASGTIRALHDTGRRPLPPKPAKNSIDADGRVWSVSYQSLIPNLEVTFPNGGPGSYKLHLASGGAEQLFEGSQNVVEVPGAKLEEATYTFWFDRDGVKQAKVSTLKINFDQTAAQVYIESPKDRQPFGDDIDVAGAALPGWTATVDSVEIPIIDATTRRFRAKVSKPADGARALAIRLSHPQRGVHYYLRRGAK